MWVSVQTCHENISAGEKPHGHAIWIDSLPLVRLA